MRTLMNRINLKLLIYTFLILLVCRIDIVFANEPIATIGSPLPLQNSFLNNDTVVRVLSSKMQIVDANTGEVEDEFGNLEYHFSSVISKTGSHVVIQNYSSSTKTYDLTIWDVNARERISSWVHDDNFQTAVFSPTQTLLATSVYDKIHLWNWQTGILIGTMVGERRPIEQCNYYTASNGKQYKTSCAFQTRSHDMLFTPDGKYLIVASQRPDIEVWHVETLQLIGHLGVHSGSWVNGLAVSPDGTYIASYDSDPGTVYLWNFQSRQLIWKQKSEIGRISDLVFSPDSQHLYVATDTYGLRRSGNDPLEGLEGWYDKVRVWDVQSAQQIDIFQTQFKAIQSLRISPDGKKLLLLYFDGEIVWDIENKRIHKTWADFANEWSYSRDVKLSPDGNTVLAMSGSFIKSWDVSSQQMRLLIPSEDYIYNTIAISHDSQKIAVGREPLIEIRDLHTGKVETQFPHSFLLPENITFSSSGKWLAVKGHWGHVDILNTDLPENKQRLEPPFKLQLPGGHYPIGFSENDQYFATSGHTKIDDISKYWIMLWERVEDTFVFKYAWLGGFAAQPLFLTNTDGSTLLAGNGRDGIHIWKLLADEPILLSSFNGVYPLQFSDDGRYLFAYSAYSEMNFQIWDWQRSKLVNQTPFPWYKSISQDGSLLLTNDVPGQYQIWDLNHMLSFLPYAVEPNGKQFVTLGQIKRNQLMQNFPNPFNPETWIPFKLADESTVTIDIHSSTGEFIRSLSPGIMTAGEYSNQSQAVHWDGKNNDGEPVSSGIYFYTINAGDFSATRKMLIQK
ncbi:MAG: T9SS type A sorting domain-containing protein [Candidatus Poribacteria bacterium]|nr:T9SS type A sorting domain-containing protein [Candidatus Poribacteria bacterium]